MRKLLGLDIKQNNMKKKRAKEFTLLKFIIYPRLDDFGRRSKIIKKNVKSLRTRSTKR
jgi:hypothetical protein